MNEIDLIFIINFILQCVERRHLFGDPSLPSRLLFKPSYTEESTTNKAIEFVQGEGGSRRPLPILRCIGFGLIRAINPERKIFYIITPVEKQKLCQVDVLALGEH